MLTTDFPFSDKNTVLDDGCPADYREALRSFVVLLDVRHVDPCSHLACTSTVHAISDVVSSNARSLQQLGERHTVVLSTLTVPMETGTALTMTRGTQVGGDECSEIAVADYGHEKTVGFAV